MDITYILQHGQLAVQKLGSRFPLRSWDSFSGRNNFAVPRWRAKSVLGRIETNVQFFLANYFVLGVLALIYAAYSSPLFILVLFAVSCVWVFLLFLRPHDSGEGVDVFGFPVPAGPLYLGTAVASVLVISIASGYMVSLWMILVVLHSVFRRRSVKSNTSLFFNKIRGRDVGSNLAHGVERVLDSEETIAIDLSANTSANSAASTNAVREHYHAQTAGIREKYSRKFAEDS